MENIKFNKNESSPCTSGTTASTACLFKVVNIFILIEKNEMGGVCGGYGGGERCAQDSGGET